MKILENYNKLSDTLKGNLTILSANAFASILTKIFLNIYVFSINGSFYELIIFNIIFYVTTSSFYILSSFIISKYKIGLKNIFKYALPFYPLSFFFLVIAPENITSAYIFWVLGSIWRGPYFNVFNTYEYEFTKKDMRQYYQSLRNIIFIVAWLLVSWGISVLFYFKESLPFWISPYDIMFFISGVIFLISYIKAVPRIESYRVDKDLKISDFKGLFSSKWNRRISFFLLLTCFWAMSWLLISMVSFYLLKSELNVWIYEFVFTIFWILQSLYLWSYLKSHQSFKALTIFSLSYFLLFVLFAYFLTIPVFIVFTLLWGLLMVSISVPKHVYTMKIIDMFSEFNWNSYAVLQYKEFLLMIWRIIILWGFLLSSFVYSTPEEVLPYWILISGLIFLFLPFSVYHIRDLVEKK